MSRVVKPNDHEWELFERVFGQGIIVGLKSPSGILLTAIFPHPPGVGLDPRAGVLMDELQELFGQGEAVEPETPADQFAQPWENPQ